EIEVLHDQLLKMFEQNPVLKPKDIIVMTPDIEIYAPYIQAVFDLPDHDPRKMPFTITDRSFRTESQVIETFMAILNLWGSRFGASQVLGILEAQAVQKKFDLSEPDLELIRQWVQDTRIRWGIDGKHRHEIGLPNLSENTWQAGLDRLLLGYALPGQEEYLFSDILPYDHIEGSDAEVLGNFLEFIDRLTGSVKSLELKRALSNWSETLNGLLDGFFIAEEDSANEIQVIRNTINQLSDLQHWSNFNEKVDINVIRCYLEHHLEKEGFGYGFLTGGITFCAMLPMRSIPAKVICLVGMNSDAYPRQSKPLGFDLVAKYPKPGDRSLRNDDRYLFLESIISARDKLYISYVGQSIQDNSTIPPSVLVSELLDYIEQGFEIPGTDIRDYLITKHRLQGFSPEYFKKNNQLFSYSSENFEAAKQLLKQREIPLPFISQGLSQLEDEWKTITLPDLCSFFANPAKFLLTKRLGIYLDEGISILEENESFEMSGLDRYFLEQSLVEKKLDDRDLKQFFSATKASGQLPHGIVGDCIYDNLSSGVESFVEKTKPYISGSMLEPLEVDLNISDFHLIGRIDTIYPAKLIQFRYAKVKARDRLKLWIYHLVLNSIHADDYPETSMLVALDPAWAGWEFVPVENSGEILAELLQIYWQGLVKPLHFFPESSWEYAQRMLEKNKSSDEALRIARNKWLGSEFSWGESADLYYQQCFGKYDPIDEQFEDLALTVFKPFLENQVKVKVSA
ncbi:MAG: exodeoxyribonuclease V subunit gamma, partial [bacterium]